MASFRDFVACSACHRDYVLLAAGEPETPQATTSIPLPFYLSTCHHTLCHVCLFATKPAPQPLDQVRLPCPACQTITPLALLVLDDPANELSTFFADSLDLANTALMVTKFQLETLMDQVAYLKPKCVLQKKTISRLVTEVKKLKGHKAENERLRAEIASLQAQVYSHQTLAHAAVSSPHAPVTESQLSPFEPEDRYVGPALPNETYRDFVPRKIHTRKRKGDDWSDPKQPVSPSQNSQHLLSREVPYDRLRPSRLTLTPASRSSHHLHHWTRSESNTEEGTGLPNIEGIKSSKIIQFSTERDNPRGSTENRASSRNDGGGARGPAAMREHLSHFTYTPNASRTSHRPQSNTSQRWQETGQTPRPASPLQSRSSQSGPNDSRSRRSERRSPDSDEDRRAMPPPPVPALNPFISHVSQRATPRSTPQRQNRRGVSPPRPSSQAQVTPRQPTPSLDFSGTHATGLGVGTNAGRMPFKPTG